MPSTAFDDVLAALDSVFEMAGVRWYVFGAQAALVHGAVRMTADVDVTVLLDSLGVEQLAEQLSKGGFTLRFDDEEFLSSTSVMPVLHDDTGINADVVLGGPGLEELFQSRATVQNVGSVRVPVATAEDIIAMKILAGREKDLGDVVAIIAAQRNELDRKLIIETLKLLQRALDRSDLIPEFDCCAALANAD